jgi:hypothetical protein
MRRRLLLAAAVACGVVGLDVGASGAGAAAQQEDPTTTIAGTPSTTSVPAGMCQGPAGLTVCPTVGVPTAVPFAGTGVAPPATPGSGLDGLLQAPPELRPDGLEPTFYERYSVGAYTLDGGITTQSPSSSGMNGMAGALWAIALWIVDAALKAFQWAFSLDLFSWLGSSVDRIVGVLRGPLFDSYLGVALAIAAVWIVWHGLARRRTLLASEGIAWTVVAMTVALIFFAAPKAVLDGVNTITTTISRGALGALAQISPDPELDDGLGQRETYAGDAADNSLRQTADQLWRTAAYQPWAIMELGSMDVAREVQPDQAVAPGQPALSYGERLLAARTFSEAELERLAAGEVTYEELRAEKLTQLTELRDDLAEHHPDAIPWLNGERSGERVGIAALALVTSLFFGGLILLLAGAVLVTQLGVLVLAATAPLFLLLGVVPGRGRLVTMRWIELFVSLAIKRVVFGIVLAIVLVLSGVLIGATATLGWGISIALQIGLVACVFVYRRAFADLFTSTSIPGTALAGALSTMSTRSTQRVNVDGLGRSFMHEFRRSWASAAARRDRRADGTTDPSLTQVLGPPSRSRRRGANRQENVGRHARRDPAAAAPSDPVGDGVTTVVPSPNGGHGNGSHPPDG